jgi:hypothetical protein
MERRSVNEEREVTVANSDVLSDTELAEVARACARVRVNDYPLHIVQLILIEILTKTAPNVADSLQGYGRSQFQALLERINGHHSWPAESQ